MVMTSEAPTAKVAAANNVPATVRRRRKLRFQAPRRRWLACRRPLGIGDAVVDPAHRLDRPPAVRHVELAAKVVHVHLNDVVDPAVEVTPDVVQELLLGHYFHRM